MFFFVKTQIQIDFLLAVAVATRRIKTGMEVHDSYGAVWYHMDRTERQRFLKVFFLLQKMKILFCFFIRIFYKNSIVADVSSSMRKFVRRNP